MSLIQTSPPASGTSATTLTITLSSPTTAGNTLVVCIGTFGETANPTITGITIGGSADNFAVAKTAYNNTYVNNAVWVDNNCAGGQTSIVVTLTGGTGGSYNIAGYAMEWSGLATSSVVDRTNSANNSTSAWSSGSSGTLSQANEVIIGSVTSDAVGLNTPGTPWTELTQISGSEIFLGVGYQTVAATTAVTYNGTATTGGSTDYGACIVTLLVASGPPPTPPGTPTGLTVTGETATTVSLEWTAPSSGGTVSTYTVYVNGTPATPVSGTSTTVIDLSPSTTYTFTVQANGPGGSGPQSSPVSATTSAAPPILIASIAPQAGVDQFGYSFVRGIATYSGTLIANIHDEDIAFYSTTFSGQPAFIQGTNSDMIIGSGALTTEVPAQLELKSATSSGTGAAETIVSGNLIVHGQSIVPQSPPTATAAAIITALTAAGIFT